MADSSGHEASEHEQFSAAFNEEQRERLLDEDYHTAAQIGILLSAILVVGLITAVVAIIWTAM